MAVFKLMEYTQSMWYTALPTWY